MSPTEIERRQLMARTFPVTPPVRAVQFAKRWWVLRDAKDRGLGPGSFKTKAQAMTWLQSNPDARAMPTGVSED